MSAPCFDIQRDWDSAGLEGWPTSFDTRYLLGRIAELAVETTAEGATGPVLEVAAAEALHAARCSSSSTSRLWSARSLRSSAACCAPRTKHSATPGFAPAPLTPSS